MNANEVVMNCEQSDGMAKVVNLLAESVGQSSETAHAHSHCQVGALYKASRNMLWIRTPLNRYGLRSKANGGAIPCFSLKSIAVNLYQRCVVDLRPKRAFDRIQIDSVTVSGELDTASKAIRQILHKVIGSRSVSVADEVANQEFRVSINCRPRPHITITKLAALGLRHVLFLSIAELPDFIALDAARSHIAHRAVMIIGACLTDLFKQSDNRSLGYTCKPTCSPDGVSFNQSIHNANLFGER